MQTANTAYFSVNYQATLGHFFFFFFNQEYAELGLDQCVIAKDSFEFCRNTPLYRLELFDIIQIGLSSRKFGPYYKQTTALRVAILAKEFCIFYHARHGKGVAELLQDLGCLGSLLEEDYFQAAFSPHRPLIGTVHPARATCALWSSYQRTTCSRMQEGRIDLEMPSPCLADVFVSPSSLFPFTCSSGLQIY